MTAQTEIQPARELQLDLCAVSKPVPRVPQSMGTLVAEVVPKGAMKRGAKIALDTRRQWVIGSDTQSAQIVVNADFLDASHAALVLSEFGDSWAVVDGGCENGTFLNGQRVTRARLQNGDSISFGLGRNVRQSSSLPEVAVRLSFRFIAAHDMLQCQAPQSVGMADDATAQDDCMAKYSKQVASVGRGAECQSQAIEIADLSAQLSHVRRQLDIVNQDKRALQAQLEIALRQVDELRADGPKLHTCLSCGAVSVVGGHLPSAPDPVAGRPALDDTIVFQGKQGAGVKLTGESDGARGPAAASLTKPESTISEGTEIGQEVWDRLEEALQKLDSKPRYSRESERESVVDRPVCMAPRIHARTRCGSVDTSDGAWPAPYSWPRCSG